MRLSGNSEEQRYYFQDIQSIQSTNLDMELQLNLENINISTKKFISKINNLIISPIKRIIKCQTKTTEQAMNNQRSKSPLRTKISKIKNALN